MPLPSLRRCLPFVLCLASAALRAAPQDAPPSTTRPAAFEVVSVKPNPNCAPGALRPVLTPGRMELPCVSTRVLIRAAYSGLTGGEISARLLAVENGPAWIDANRYDIDAKPEKPTSAETMLGPMLQTLLEDRFKLKIHKEGRETSVYFLTVGEGAPKLQPSKEGDCVPMDLFALQAPPSPNGPTYCGGGRATTRDGMLFSDWTGVTMAELAGRALGGYAGRPVVDKTGLAGRFNIHLEFAPPRPSGPVMLNGQPVILPPQPDDAGTSIFTAVQKQLGLKLSPGKAPIDVLVIDSIEKPSEN